MGEASYVPIALFTLFLIRSGFCWGDYQVHVSIRIIRSYIKVIGFLLREVIECVVGEAFVCSSKSEFPIPFCFRDEYRPHCRYPGNGVFVSRAAYSSLKGNDFLRCYVTSQCWGRSCSRGDSIQLLLRKLMARGIMGFRLIHGLFPIWGISRPTCPKQRSGAHRSSSICGSSLLDIAPIRFLHIIV